MHTLYKLKGLCLKLSHNCAGYSVLGVLGDSDVWMEEYREDQDELQGYQRKGDKKGGRNSMVRIKHFTWEHIERMTGMR